MNRKKIQHSRLFLTLALAFSLILGGCLNRGNKPAPTTASPFADTAAESYEHFEEQQLNAQARFEKLLDKLFADEVSGCLLDMHFLLKDPSAFGIAGAKNLYTPLTEEFLAKNQNERQKLEEDLSSFDPSLLTDSQKATLRILQSFLKTEKMADGLDLYAHPLAVTIGTQAQLPILLSEYIFYTKQDIEDYLKLLGGIDEYYQQLLDFEKRKSEAGLMMSDTTIDHIIESCESYILVPGDNFMVNTFDSRLQQVPGLTEEEKDTYRKQNISLLENDFVPAYQLLIDGLRELKGTGTNEGGQCGYPQGKEYYEYLVYSSTGTSYKSIEDMLAAMENQMDESLQKISEILKAHPELRQQIDNYQFRQTEPNSIMEELKSLTQDRYPTLPECSYTFKDVPKALELSLSPAFYLVSPIDDHQNNVIYINHNPNYSSNDLYTVIAHEGYPGHLYQNVYFHTNCDSKIRMLLSFPGYTEGWATYVELDSYCMDNGLSPEMGQLLAANYLATLGLSACLDVYVNYMCWDKEQVKEYLENFGSASDEVVDSVYNTMVETPANYLSYYVGCMEFLNMQKTAQAQLGMKYDQKAFHKFLLDMGNAPFDVIQPYFTSWLMEQKL